MRHTLVEKAGLVNCRDYWSDIDLIIVAKKWLAASEEQRAELAETDPFLHDLCGSVVVSLYPVPFSTRFIYFVSLSSPCVS